MAACAWPYAPLSMPAASMDLILQRRGKEAPGGEEGGGGRACASGEEKGGGKKEGGHGETHAAACHCHFLFHMHHSRARCYSMPRVYALRVITTRIPAAPLGNAHIALLQHLTLFL